MDVRFLIHIQKEESELKIRGVYIIVLVKLLTETICYQSLELFILFLFFGVSDFPTYWIL